MGQVQDGSFKPWTFEQLDQVFFWAIRHPDSPPRRRDWERMPSEGARSRLRAGLVRGGPPLKDAQPGD